MKTLFLVAFVGCILATHLAIRFDESEGGEQFNADLKESEDLPFLRKAEGKYVFDTEDEIFGDDTIDEENDEDSANDDDDDDGDDKVDEDMDLNDHDDDTKKYLPGQLKILSDPRRRIRIRPRVIRQVRRFVRKPLILRRLRRSTQYRHRGQKGR